MWTGYQIGIEQIDEQHKQIIQNIEDILVMIKKPETYSPAECKQFIEFLKNYTSVHFRAEEIHQETIGFALAEEHRQMHEGFKERLREYEFRLIRSDYSLEVVKELAIYLTQWLLYHIMREDKKMADPKHSTTTPTKETAPDNEDALAPATK